MKKYIKPVQEVIEIEMELSCTNPNSLVNANEIPMGDEEVWD